MLDTAGIPRGLCGEVNRHPTSENVLGSQALFSCWLGAIYRTALGYFVSSDVLIRDVPQVQPDPRWGLIRALAERQRPRLAVQAQHNVAIAVRRMQERSYGASSSCRRFSLCKGTLVLSKGVPCCSC